MPTTVKVEEFSLNPNSTGLFKFSPLGFYSDKEINDYILNVKECLDSAVYGHNKTKTSILEIVSQWITNPISTTKIIALKGSPGTGKTSIIRDGLSKALNIPMGTVALGGTRDGSILDGHVYTW